MYVTGRAGTTPSVGGAGELVDFGHTDVAGRNVAGGKGAGIADRCLVLPMCPRSAVHLQRTSHRKGRTVQREVLLCRPILHPKTVLSLR